MSYIERASLHVPHICGEIIDVTAVNRHYPGSYFEPPEDDTQFDHPTQCPKCGIDLTWDSLFQANIDRALEDTNFEPDEDDYAEPDWPDVEGSPF